MTLVRRGIICIVLTLGLAGCFDAQPREGILCTVHDECPSGMWCDRFEARPACHSADAGVRAQPDWGTAPAPEMIAIPGGLWARGCNPYIDVGCEQDEEFTREVTVPGFEIGKLEITHAQFAACFNAGKCRAPAGLDSTNRANMPMTNVSWLDAREFCAFANMRLPTEAEWEYAARGGPGRTYPWGETPGPDCAFANISGCGGTLKNVGSTPNGATPEGVMDMAGNAAEWVQDWYKSPYESDTSDPRGPEDGQEKVVRGGKYDSLAKDVKTYSRERRDPGSFSTSGIGFRCAR